MRLALLLGLLSLPTLAVADQPLAMAAPDEPIDITRQDLDRLIRSGAPFTLATRYPNGNPKVQGTVIWRNRRLMAESVLRIWHPNGRLYQVFDPALNTVKTFHPDGPLLEEDHDALTLGEDSVTTRYFTSGQMRERTVERHTTAKERFHLYYAFGPQDEATPVNKLSIIRRSEHTQFRKQEAWHPNGHRHWIATLHLGAPIERQTVYQYFDPDGRPAPDTRYAFHTGPPRSGWRREGLHRTYWDDGTLQSTIEYRQGLKSGRARRWAANGQLVEDGLWADGKIGERLEQFDDVGRLGRWWADGRRFEAQLDAAGRLRSYSAKFASGEFHVGFDPAKRRFFESIRLPYSQVRHYHATTDPKNSAPLAQHRFTLTNGRPTGRWVAQPQERHVVADLSFDDEGRPHGRARQWHPNGQLAVDCQFEHGAPRGPIETWFADGKRALRASFGAKGFEGRYERWYADGTLAEHEIRGPERTRILGRWDRNGKPTALEVDNPDGPGRITKHFHNNVLHLVEYHRPEARTVDEDRFNAMGEVTHRIRHVDDRPGHKVVTTFWPTGNLKTRVTWRDGKIIGTRETWHANGQPATTARFDAKGRQGVLKTWTADGKRAPDRHFVDGVEQIAARADRCHCNVAYRAPEQFLNSAGQFLSLSQIQSALPLTVQGYARTFLRTRVATADHVQGDLVSMDALSVASKGVTLLLNPCRHGANHSAVPMTARTRADGLHIRLEPTRVGVSLPVGILQRAAGRNLPLVIRQDVEAVGYTRKGGLAIDGARNTCAETARVGLTPLRLDVERATVEQTDDGGLSLRIPAAKFAYRTRKGRVIKGTLRQLEADGADLTAILTPDAAAADDLAMLTLNLGVDGFDVTPGPDSLRIRWRPARGDRAVRGRF